MKPKELLERKEIDDSVFMTDEEIDRLADSPEKYEVAEKVKEISGYYPPSLDKKMKEVERKIAVARQPLAKALKQCHIAPFTEESVELYKRKMVKRPFQMEERELAEWIITLLMVGGFYFNISLFAWIGSMIVSVLYNVDGYNSGLMLGIIPVYSFFRLMQSIWNRKAEEMEYGIFTFALVLFSLPYVIVSHLFSKDSREWKKVSLDSAYDRDIPESALQKVATISEKCPEARFYVLELTNKPDPFLVVTLNEEEYYVDVWDEPGFKAETLVEDLKPQYKVT